MKNIRNYETKTAYDADATRPANENTVSLVKDVNIIMRNGANIITEGRFTGIGDTVVYDTVDLRYKVVRLGTLKLPLSTRYIVTGTVWGRNEKNVFMVANQNLAAAQWGAPWKVKLSGFSFASAGSFTLTINSTTTAAISYTTTDTLTTLAASMQTAIRAVMTVATWTVTDYANYIVVEQSSHTPNVTSFTCSNAGITVNILTGNYQTANSGLVSAISSIFRNDGSASSYAGGNLEKYILYYSVSGADTTGGTLLDVAPIRESRFNVTDNPILYNYYGTYRAYMTAKMTRYPYSKGAIIDGNGKSNTDKLSILFTDHDATQKPSFPAAYAAKTFSVAGTSGISWWLPSVQELYLIMRSVTDGLSGVALDPLNTGLAAAGGTKINVANAFWSSSEHGGINAFIYYGTYGTMHASSKFSSITLRPVSAFQIL